MNEKSVGANERYWQEMFDRYDRVRPEVPCVGDLLNSRDPVVRAYVQLWVTGNLTFEQMAVALVLELSERCRRYSENELRRLQTEVKPVVVPVHDLYTDADADAPSCVRDDNGRVVLGLCKRCGRAEAELSELCVP